MGRFGINRDSYGFEIPDIYNNAASGPSYSAEYQTVYDSFIVKPAADIAQQQDIMVRALVAAGVWAKLDVFYIFANNTRANAVINWMNPGAFDAIEVNAPTFLAYRHFVGNGVNQYLRTQWSASVDAVNYTQNDASGGLYIRTDISETKYDYGWAGASDHYFQSRNGANQIALRVNDNTSVNAASANSTGMWINQRVANTGPNSVQCYRNSVQIINGNTTSAALTNLECFILCLNNGGVPAVYSTKQAALFFLGASLDEAGSSEVTNATNAINTYMTYIGANTF